MDGSSDHVSTDLNVVYVVQSSKSHTMPYMHLYLYILMCMNMNGMGGDDAAAAAATTTAADDMIDRVSESEL